MNYSGFTVTREIKEFQIDVRPKEEGKNPEKTDTYEQKLLSIEDKETQRIMALYEQTRQTNPELFNYLMQSNKEMLDIVSSKSTTYEDIKRLDELFRKVEVINDDFTFWIVMRGVNSSILETKNLDIVHFFLVKKGFELPIQFYENILHQYIRSLSDLDFIDEANSDEINKYSTVLQMMIEYGKVDVNEREKGTHYTPLHLAVIFKQLQFVIILLHNGCDINAKSKDGESALDVANAYIADEGEDKLVYQKIADVIGSNNTIN